MYHASREAPRNWTRRSSSLAVASVACLSRETLGNHVAQFFFSRFLFSLAFDYLMNFPSIGERCCQTFLPSYSVWSPLLTLLLLIYTFTIFPNSAISALAFRDDRQSTSQRRVEARVFPNCGFFWCTRGPHFFFFLKFVFDDVDVVLRTLRSSLSLSVTKLNTRHSRVHGGSDLLIIVLGVEV